MQRMELETINIGAKAQGLLRTLVRSKYKEVVLSVNIIDEADENDNKMLLQRLELAYKQYYDKVSEYM